MKVLVHNGHEWARKCWSTRGMSGHKSVGPLKVMFDSSSTGTLACVKLLETVASDNVSAIRTRGKSSNPLAKPIFSDPLNSARGLCSNGHNCCCSCQKCVYE
jgi:hypothetical protein